MRLSREIMPKKEALSMILINFLSLKKKSVLYDWERTHVT